jgi:integrase
MCHTGIRVDELRDLRFGDVVTSERKGILIVRAGKGMKHRRVPLTAVGALLGHESLQSTAQYTQPTERDQETRCRSWRWSRSDKTRAE